MADDQMLQKREQDPSEFGAKKFYVELFTTTRQVVSVYAENEDSAIKKTLASPYFSDGGSLRGFNLTNGVANVQYDGDHGCRLTTGDVQEDNDG